MGTKRTDWTNEDSLQLPSNQATPDKGYQSNEWTNRKARPQAGPEIQAGQVREREVQTAREMDRMQKRQREGRKDINQDQRARERLAIFKERRAEEESGKRERRQEEGKNTNGRTASRQYDEYREREKGDTFPRTSRQSNEREIRVRHSIDQGYEKDIKRLREAVIGEREQEKDRVRPRRRDKDIQKHREMERLKINEEMRWKENGKRTEGRRLDMEDRIRESEWDIKRRERKAERDTEANDQQIMRREVDRDKHRPGRQFYSPQRSRIMERDRENFSDREERDEIRGTEQRDRRRYAKSEGDINEQKEREVTTEDSLRQDPSKSEQYSKGGRANRELSERELHIEMERQKERARRKMRERELYREVERQKERGNEREITTSESRGRKGEREWMKEKYKEHYRESERKQREWEREKREPDGQKNQESGSVDRRREKEFLKRIRREYDTEKARSSYTSEKEKAMYAKIKTGAISSGEALLGSAVENNQGKRGIKDNIEERERERENISDSDREKNIKRSQGALEVITGLRDLELKEDVEKQEIETEIKKLQYKQRPHRKMWLEPRSGNERTSSLLEEYREKTTGKEMYAQTYTEQKTLINEEETSAKNNNSEVPISPEEGNWELDKEFIREPFDSENMEEGRISDGIMEPVFDDEEEVDDTWEMEAEFMAYTMEERDREEERGSDRHCNSEGEEGSEGEWEEGKERMTSGDDGFVTVSSGADDDEADEDKFEDCKEFCNGGDREDLTRQSPTRPHHSEEENETSMTKARSDHTVTVFCVVGQTLPRSGSNQKPLMDDLEQEETGRQSLTETGDESDHDATQVSDKEKRDLEQEETGRQSLTETGDESNHDATQVSDKEEKKENTVTCLTTSEKDIFGKHDPKLDKAEHDKNTKEALPPEEDLMITGKLSVGKTTETHTTESSEIFFHPGDPEAEKGDGRGEKNSHLEETGSTTEYGKRLSAAPHVKWAKNVLSEILGSSDENLNMPEPNDAPLNETESVVQTPPKHSHVSTCIESLHSRPEDPIVENEILMHDEELEFGDAQYYMLQHSSDLNSLSSEGEPDKEESSNTDSKRKKKPVWKILSSSSLRDIGNEAWGRRKGIRKTLQKQNEDEEEAGVGRDRRTRVFPSEDAFDLHSSWSEVDLKTFKDKISRPRMRNSKFYNSQLYQQYSEVVQNRELLHQSHSDSSSVFGEVGAFHASSSPCSSPILARRPLPALPHVTHPHSLSHINSVSSLSEALGIPLSPPQKPSSPRLSKSFASSPMLWQDLPGVRNNPELKTFNDDQRRLQEVRFEVLTSEASYYSSLDIVVEHFVKSKQLNMHLTSQDRNWLFSRLCDVRAISHNFLTQLEDRVESDIMHFTVCDIIIKHCPGFRSVYVPYLTNQSYQDKTYQRLINENTGFRHLVEKLEQSPKCQRLPFRSFLILPFQRITRLKLLVQNILKRTAPKSKDEAQAIKAMKLLEKMIQESNDSISQMKSIESLVSLNAKVDFECKTLPLISQSRRLVKEGLITELRDFSLKERERATYIHLFNDYLLLSLPKESGRFTVIDHAPVSEVRAENCRLKLHSLSKNVFRLHMSQKPILLRTDMQADKMRWISALSRPHPEVDFNAAQDIPQMQCIRAFVSQQPDELSLEKADVLLVHQQSSDGWVEGTRLSDRQRGWVPDSHLEMIKSEKVRQRNLIDTLKITIATATG